ncbi:TPA: restriction endonuclease subunit S, partial [Enterococcus faecium]
MSNDTQPEIRFPGFTDDWEQRKLGDFVVDYVEKTSVQNQFPMLTSSQQKGIVLQEDYFANRQVTTENNIGYFVLPRGYFTFRSRSDNDVFVFNRNDIIDRGIISYFYPVFTLKSADSDFFLRRINNGIQRQLSIQAEGTGQHVLSLKKFKNIVAMFPSEEEQQKIGTFFKQLDDTIALHQRKLDLLKETKKGFLQKMFPENGAKVPEVRFPGFTEDWEERKFGLLFEKNLEKNKNSEFDASRTISIATMHFKEEGNGAAESSLATYKVLRVGDIAYEGHTSKQFAFGRFVLNDIGDGIMSPRFTTLRPTSERPISFWKQYIHYEPIMRHLLVRSTKNGTMMNELVIPDLEKESLLVPSESEQKQIGAFFDKLDETITLHQRKLDLLKETKKGF